MITPQPTRLEQYQKFVDFIGTHTQHERKKLNRRILYIFIWCFILPAVSYASALILLKHQVLPIKFKPYIEWIILGFPVTYSIYFFTTEVLTGLPGLFKQGGVSSVLTQTKKDTEWRDRVASEMSNKIKASQQDWRWIIQNYRADLESMKFRTAYLTAFAGAVFFFLTQGISLLRDQDLVMVKDNYGRWIEMPPVTDFTQWVSLGLFLLLLYLSGSYTNHYLRRYLDAAELVLQDQTHL